MLVTALLVVLLLIVVLLVSVVIVVILLGILCIVWRLLLLLLATVVASRFAVGLRHCFDDDAIDLVCRSWKCQSGWTIDERCGDCCPEGKFLAR